MSSLIELHFMCQEDHLGGKLTKSEPYNFCGPTAKTIRTLRKLLAERHSTFPEEHLLKI